MKAIAFNHIPKCAGTSIAQSLSQQYLSLYCSTVYDAAAIRLILDRLEEPLPVFVFGHTPDIQSFFPQFQAITVLREPFSRSYSLYRHLNKLETTYAPKSFQEFIKNYPRNFFVNWLACGDREKAESILANEYTSFGLQEFFSDSARLFNASGIPLNGNIEINVTGEDTNPHLQDYYEQFAQHNAEDILLYDNMKALFLERVEKLAKPHDEDREKTELTVQELSSKLITSTSLKKITDEGTSSFAQHLKSTPYWLNKIDYNDFELINILERNLGVQHLALHCLGSKYMDYAIHYPQDADVRSFAAYLNTVVVQSRLLDLYTPRKDNLNYPIPNQPHKLHRQVLDSPTPEDVKCEHSLENRHAESMIGQLLDQGQPLQASELATLWADVLSPYSAALAACTSHLATGNEDGVMRSFDTLIQESAKNPTINACPAAALLRKHGRYSQALSLLKQSLDNPLYPYPIFREYCLTLFEAGLRDELETILAKHDGFNMASESNMERQVEMDLLLQPGSLIISTAPLILLDRTLRNAPTTHLEILVSERLHHTYMAHTSHTLLEDTTFHLLPDKRFDPDTDIKHVDQSLFNKKYPFVLLLCSTNNLSSYSNVLKLIEKIDCEKIGYYTLEHMFAQGKRIMITLLDREEK